MNTFARKSTSDAGVFLVPFGRDLSGASRSESCENVEIISIIISIPDFSFEV